MLNKNVRSLDQPKTSGVRIDPWYCSSTLNGSRLMGMRWAHASMVSLRMTGVDGRNMVSSSARLEVKKGQEDRIF